MIKISINTKRITRKPRVTEKGSYRDFVLFDKPDQYGNDGFVKEDVTKEEREAGAQGAIVGNWKNLGTMKQKREEAAPAPAASNDLDEDDIPF